MSVNKYIFALFSFILLFPSVAVAGTYLSWIPPTEYTDGSPLSGAVGTKLYYGTSSGNYGTSVDLGTQTNFLLSSLPAGPTYFLATKSYDTNGCESAFSEEMAWVSVVETPAFSPGAGVYTGSVEVTISSGTAGAAIHYTTDGSDPDASSPLFNGPLSLTADTTLKALGLKPGSAASPIAQAVYDIVADEEPPTILSAKAEGDLTQLLVTFSESLDPASAQAVFHYDLSPAGSLFAATLLPGERTVRLTTSPLTPGNPYTLTVNHVSDTAQPPNVIAPDSRVSFIPTEHEYIDLEAEAALLTSPMATAVDPHASGGQYVYSPTAEQGHVDFSFTVAGGTYYIWALAECALPNPSGHNSFYLALDGGPEDTWDLFNEWATEPPTLWTWERVSLRCGGDYVNHLCDPAAFDLAAGSHHVVLRGREADTRIDRILVTTDPLYAPSMIPLPNEVPVVTDDVYAMEEDGVLTVDAATGVLANDYDADDDFLTPSVQQGPVNGSLVFNADGSFTYTPREGFQGTETFTYALRDDFGGLAVGLVTITIQDPSGAYHWFEGEAGVLIGPVDTGQDPRASGGKYVTSSESEQGSIEFSITVPGGDYVIWALAAADSQNPYGSDSFHVSVDGGTEDIWDLFYDLPSGPATDWAWDRVSGRCGGGAGDNLCDPRIFSLSAGTHTLTFRGREPQARLDKILITSDLSYTLDQAPFNPDQDGDGLCDAWETAQFGGMSEASGGAADDYDRDGITNEEEFIAGSDANHAGSYPQLSIVMANGQVVVSYEATEAEGLAYQGFERRYTLEQCTLAAGSAWNPITGFQDTLATNQSVSFVSPASESLVVYRTRIRLESTD